jgi:cytochrome b6-f complex iron-sulfur subunit
MDRLNDALDALLEERSPRAMTAHLTGPERSMLRMAQRIRGFRPVAPTAEFVSALHDRLHSPPRRIDRRTVLSSVGALAAGLLGGTGLGRGILLDAPTSPLPRQQPIVSQEGTWFEVAAVADVPEGAVRTFTAGAVRGVLINQHGKVWAISSICTHMGCILNLQAEDRKLVCPCHGAEYDLQGIPTVGRRYPPNLRPLPEVEVRVSAAIIEVHGARPFQWPSIRRVGLGRAPRAK